MARTPAAAGRIKRNKIEIMFKERRAVIEPAEQGYKLSLYRDMPNPETMGTRPVLQGPPTTHATRQNAERAASQFLDMKY